MKITKKHLKNKIVALVAVAVFSAPVMAENPQAEYESPSFFAMIGDLLVARPLLLAATVVGTAVYVLSAPFAALGGNIKQTGDTLVVMPFDATFNRCLGCSVQREQTF